MEQKDRKTKGVKRLILGLVLLSLGLLNSMLALKAGLKLDAFNLAILSLGAVGLLSGLLAKRTIRANRRGTEPRIE